MKRISIISSVLSVVLSVGCTDVKQEAKDVINKSGEIIGESSSEFIDGVSKGIDKKYKCEFYLDSVKFPGIETGKYEILETEGADDNLLSLYLIFNTAVSDSAIIKVYDQENLEYGRTKVFISGKKDDAHYIDVQFDDRVSLESISKFTFE